MTTLRLSLALAAATAAAACSSDSTTGPEPLPTPAYSIAAEKAVGPSLVQRVRLSTNQPARGDTLVIRSTVKNEGSAPATVKHVVCGFDYEPNDVLQQPFVICAAYSMTSTIAPGDSIMHQDRRVVAGRPGPQVVRLAHLVEPKQTAQVALTVR